jgi:PTS system nitrogen regulatory IIA component
MMESIRDILPREMIEPELVSEEKAQVIEELVRILKKENPSLDRTAVVRRVLERERLGSTGIGHGIAIPHCKLENLKNLMCCFGRSRMGVEFQSADNAPATIFFLIVAPENAAGEHLRALARISRMCQKEEFRRRVMEAPTADEIYQAMLDED